jgi:hypothetical protein
MSARLACVWVAGFVVACGGAPAAKAPLPPPPATAPVVVEEPPDLSPVTRPAEVVLTARLARPRLFVETLAQWSSLPVRVEDLLPEQAKGLTGAVLWETPIEMLVALDAFGEGKLPPPLMVASLGLKSVADGLRAADSLQLPTRRLAPGVYRVGDFADSSCAIAASLGRAPARLICGQAVKDVDALLPYATRGLPSEPQTGADFELSLDAKPIQERYGRDIAAARLFAGVALREISLDSPRFDRALSDAIYGGVDELINVFSDLERLRIEARLDAQRSTLVTSAELRLQGQASWVAGTIASLKPAEVPATLPRLPPAALAATYNVALPEERYIALRRIVGDLLDGYLEHEKAPDATRKRTRRLVDDAIGHFPEAFSFAMPSAAAVADPASLYGRDPTLTRYSEPAARFRSAFDDLGAALSDPTLKRWLKQRVKLEDKAWPKWSKKPFKLAGFKEPATAFDLSIDVEAWGKLSEGGARALEYVFPPSGAAGPRHLSFVLQPDGPFTYLGVGADTAEIARVVAEQKKAEPGALFAKPAHSEKVLMAGFLTLKLLARTLGVSLKEPELGKAMAAAPHHGETPIPFSTSVGPGSARVDLELPAAAFADATASAMRAAPAVRDAIQRQR